MISHDLFGYVAFVYNKETEAQRRFKISQLVNGVWGSNCAHVTPGRRAPRRSALTEGLHRPAIWAPAGRVPTPCIRAFPVLIIPVCPLSSSQTLLLRGSLPVAPRPHLLQRRVLPSAPLMSLTK